MNGDPATFPVWMCSTAHSGARLRGRSGDTASIDINNFPIIPIEFPLFTLVMIPV